MNFIKTLLRKGAGDYVTDKTYITENFVRKKHSRMLPFLKKNVPC